jgi:hypothetical protein
MSDLFLPSDMMTRHCLGIAATGGGKSNFLNLILKQQMMRGGGVLHIDGKNNKDAIREFLTLAKQHHRWHDVRIINIDEATLSNTYNPLLRGDAEELTTRIMLLIGKSSGDSYFRSQAGMGLGAISGLIKRMNMPFNFEDLSIIMGSEGALRYLLREGPKDTREYFEYNKFIDNLVVVNRGVKQFDEKKLQHTFGDLLGKLAAYTRGHARDVLNVYNPEVDILQAMKENLLVYVALPMLSKAEMATDFAKVLLSDLRTAVGHLQNTSADQRPNPTFLCLLDEFSSYAMPTMAPLFEQARSANVCLFPFIQTISSLSDQGNGLSPEFAAKILGNTWNKIAFVLKEPESCKQVSELSGQSLKEFATESMTENLSFGDTGVQVMTSGSRGRSHSTSTRVEYDAVARPEDFANLKEGEAIYMGRKGVFKLRVPFVNLQKDSGEIDFPRFRMPPKAGLEISGKYHLFSATGGGS